MRIQINLSDEILSRVDQEAKKIGTSRGAMLTTWIGEKINNLDQTKALLDNFSKSDTFKELASIFLEREKEKEVNGK